MNPYSNDLRRKLVEAYESGGYSQDELAELFGVCPATLRNFIRRKRETGSPDALPHSGGRAATLAADDHDRLRQLVKGHDDATLAELCRMVERELKKSISASALCRLLQALGLPRKKSRSTPPSATRRGSSAHGLLTGG